MTLPDRLLKVFGHLEKVTLLEENIRSYDNGDRGFQWMVLEREWESKAALSWPWVRAHPQDTPVPEMLQRSRLWPLFLCHSSGWGGWIYFLELCQARAWHLVSLLAGTLGF